MQLPTAVPKMLLVSGPLLGCGHFTHPADNHLNDRQQLLATLLGYRIEAEAGSVITQEFFSKPGRLLVLGGETIRVFEYENEASRRQDSKRITAGASSVATTLISWVTSRTSGRRDGSSFCSSVLTGGLWRRFSRLRLASARHALAERLGVQPRALKAVAWPDDCLGLA